MAKTKSKSRARAAMERWQPRAQMAVARAAPVVRRVGGAAAAAAVSEKHTLAALAGAGILGYLEKEDMLAQWSFIDGIDPKVQLALITWFAGRMTKNKTIQHVATGVASVALFDAIKNRA